MNSVPVADAVRKVQTEPEDARDRLHGEYASRQRCHLEELP